MACTLTIGDGPRTKHKSQIPVLDQAAVLEFDFSKRLTHTQYGQSITSGKLKRITIIGNGGGGKSTLAIEIGETLNLPVVHLDQILWKDKWVAIEETEFIERHNKLVLEPEWIIEGLGYNSTINSRIEQSDTVIFLDYPLVKHYYWATKRSLMSPVTRPKGWAGKNSLIRKLPYIFRIIWHVHSKTRPLLISIIAQQNKSKTIIHIKSKRQLIKFHKLIELQALI